LINERNYKRLDHMKNNRENSSFDKEELVRRKEQGR
jgi:hypothetical protein